MSVLEGYTFEPFFVEPRYYDLMAYPIEWVYEGLVNEKILQEHLPMFYTRNWGRLMVANFPTLVYKEELGEWFVDDPSQGIKGLMRSQSNLKMFPSDCSALLQEGRLKFFNPAITVKVNGYVIAPLIPSKIESPRISKMNLGIPLPPEQAIADLRSILS